MKMKEKYFVIGLRKIKTAEEFKNKIVGHNHRTREYIKNPHKNIDWERTSNNIVLQELKYKSANDLIKNGNNNRKGKARRLKKGSAFAFEIIVDCSPRKDWTEENYVEYLKDAYDFFKKRFEGQEIVSAVIHLDETKPHLHITFSYFSEELGKWNQRGLMQKKLTDLNKLLNDFQKNVGEKYGFIRGKGKEIEKPIKKILEKAVEEVDIKDGLLKTEKKKVINIQKAYKQIKTLNNKVKRLIKEAEHYKKIEDNYKELQRENLMLSKEKEELEKRLRALEEKAILLEKENQSLKEENKKLKEKNILLVENYNKALQIAAKERHLRLRNKVCNQMLDKTIEGIRKENDLTL